MPAILCDLQLAGNLNSTTDPNEIVANGINKIQSLSGDTQNAFMHSLSILLAQEISKAQGQTLNWSDGVYVIEWYYQCVVKGI